MVKMGEHSYNATNDIDCYEGVELTIGKFCSIGSGLKIYSGTHPCIEYPLVVSQFPFREQWGVDYPPSKMGGKVVIKNDVWIATDVRILEGVTIGNGAVVGAGAMVTRDVPDYAFVAGNPARVKGFRFGAIYRRKLAEIAWWDWTDEKIREALPFMGDRMDFIEKYG